MVQQISDAELEIMKIVWGNPEDVTLFPYIMDGLAARGKPCQKNTLIVLLSRLMNKGFLSAKKIGRRNEYTTLIGQPSTSEWLPTLDILMNGLVKQLSAAPSRKRCLSLRIVLPAIAAIQQIFIEKLIRCTLQSLRNIDNGLQAGLLDPVSPWLFPFG